MALELIIPGVRLGITETQIGNDNSNQLNFSRGTGIRELDEKPSIEDIANSLGRNSELEILKANSSSDTLQRIARFYYFDGHSSGKIQAVNFRYLASISGSLKNPGAFDKFADACLQVMGSGKVIRQLKLAAEEISQSSSPELISRYSELISANPNFLELKDERDTISQRFVSVGPGGRRLYFHRHLAEVLIYLEKAISQEASLRFCSLLSQYSISRVSCSTLAYLVNENLNYITTRGIERQNSLDRFFDFYLDKRVRNSILYELDISSQTLASYSLNGFNDGEVWLMAWLHTGFKEDNVAFRAMGSLDAVRYTHGRQLYTAAFEALYRIAQKQNYRAADGFLKFFEEGRHEAALARFRDESSKEDFIHMLAGKFLFDREKSPEQLIDYIASIKNKELADTISSLVTGNVDFYLLMKHFEQEISLSSDRKLANRLMYIFHRLRDPKELLEYAKRINRGEFTSIYDMLDCLQSVSEFKEKLPENGGLIDGSQTIERIVRVQTDRIRAKYGISGQASLPMHNVMGFMRSSRNVLEEKDPNIEFLIRGAFRHGSLKQFIESDASCSETLGLMKAADFNTDFYVASGQTVLQRKGEGGEIANWQEAFQGIIFKLFGPGEGNQLISIPHVSRGRLYADICGIYNSATRGNAADAIKVLEHIRERVENAGNSRHLSRTLEKFHDSISEVMGQIKYGVRSKGGEITARVWSRHVPEDFYDNERLRCCFFGPRGIHSYESPLLLMDPKTTMLQYWIEAMNENAGTAIEYAGKNNDILVGSVETNHMVNAVLGNSSTKKFILDSIVIAADKSLQSGNKKALVYDSSHGSPMEFVNFVKEHSKVSLAIRYVKDYYFEAADVDDNSLANSRNGMHRHHTEAFGIAPLSGKINAYVIDVKEYLKELVADKTSAIMPVHPSNRSL